MTASSLFPLDTQWPEKPGGQGKSGKRWLALWFPYLPVDRIMRSGSQADHPVLPLVITDTIKNAARLSAISPQARRAGLAVGLTLADARARIPDLWVEEGDARADMKLLEQIAEDCDRFTPVVVMDGRTDSCSRSPGARICSVERANFAKR